LESDAKPILNNIIPDSKKYRDAGVECHWDGGRNGYEISFFPPEKPWGEMVAFVSIKEAHIKIATNFANAYKTFKFHLAGTNSVLDASAKLNEIADGVIASLGASGHE
jgi:hypothetical protein